MAASVVVGTLSASATAASTDGKSKIVFDLADLRFVLRDAPRSVAGLRLDQRWPTYRLADVVDTDYPLYDESVERLAARRVMRLRKLGVRRAVRADFASHKYLVVMQGLLLPDAGRAARTVALLREVHEDSFDIDRPIPARKLGSGAWGYNSIFDTDGVTAFGFQVGNLALRVQVSPASSKAYAISLEVLRRAQSRA